MKRLRKKTGFTLLEVLLALSLAATAVVALLRLHVISIRMVDRSQTQVQAAALAEQKMAELMMAGWPPLGTDTGSLEQEGRDYHWRTEVTDWKLPEPIGADLLPARRILVEIRWEQGKKEKKVQLVSCAADRSLP
ncbi:MAG: Bacterial type II secretion system protein I [Planctomycetes bacterium ADurb.Bin412]|nr:MAG: Bacterial type II secretion system protein I [Planctomycetes bacterium ADurb.Bin412]